MARSKNKKAKKGMDPMLIAKEKEALKRRHRKTVLFNDRENSLLEEYCVKNNVKAKSALIRRIVMERLLTEMGQNPPSLF